MEKQLPNINEDRDNLLSQVECFALDMDGTVYLG